MNKFFCPIVFVVMVLLAACNNQPQNAATNQDSAAQKQTEVVVSPVDNAIAKEAATKQLDALEHLFDNQNYLILEGIDSSYFYVSRLGKYNIFTHSYRMVKGDSADLRIDTIKINGANKVQWNWKGKQLLLNNATDYTSSWAVSNNENDKIEFQRIDKKTLRLVQAGKTLPLYRTLTLSLFLVRSYYDYQHGSHLAFDSSNFTKKHK